jgi:hypothetical protein
MDASDALNATYGKEGGTPAAYQPGTMPGIEVVADFNEYHRAGQPYGMWIVDAEWRNEDRHAIAKVSVPFMINAVTGIGRAYLPASFLDAVFADAVSRFQASEDTSTWFHRPGLYLNVIPFEDVDAYYDFARDVPAGWTWELSNWSFGDGLEYLVNQLDLRWWPERPPLTNVAALIDIQDPIGIKKIAPAAPAAPATAAWCRPPANLYGFNWYYVQGGESCNSACVACGSTVNAAGLNYFVGNGNAANECAALIPAVLGAGGAGGAIDNNPPTATFGAGGANGCHDYTNDPPAGAIWVSDANPQDPAWVINAGEGMFCPCN